MNFGAIDINASDIGIERANSRLRSASFSLTRDGIARTAPCFREAVRQALQDYSPWWPLHAGRRITLRRERRCPLNLEIGPKRRDWVMLNYGYNA